MPRRPHAQLAGIESVYRERLARFRRVAAAILGDPEAALDAVQDAFAKALRQRDDYRGEGSLEAWLWRVVVNTARDRRRSTAAEPVAERTGSDHQGNGSATVDERVAAAILLLPERQRLAVFLRYYADLDYATIARVLEVSAGTIAASLNAAHASLRRSLQEVRP